MSNASLFIGFAIGWIAGLFSIVVGIAVANGSGKKEDRQK